MKKIFYLASIAALAFSSCAKDDTTQAELGTVTGGSKITAAMGTDTRTYLDENKQFRWEGTDAIAVYNDNAAARMNGTQFKMTEGDKSTVAVFNGPALNAKYNHLAVYPWTQQKAFTDVVWAKDVQIPGKANGNTGNILSYTASGDADVSATNWVGKVDKIVANIPATQEYYPGTFGNGVVPAISTRFDIAADGSADVSMQPVADYLFVDIMSVEPIKDLTLEMFTAGGQLINIAGSNALTSYLYDGTIRYYMGEPTGADASKAIKLVTNERAPEVSCHAANTYVFVIPAGILGADVKDGSKGVEAFITVNKGVTGKEWVFKAVNTTTLQSGETTVTRITNNQLNYKLKDAAKKDELANRVSRVEDSANKAGYKNKTIPAYNLPMENSYFWFNTKNDKGEVVALEYNPNNTYIIEHEGHLLQYLTEYGTPDFNKKADGKVDAIICAQHTFDFSKDHIIALSDQKDALNQKVYAEFEKYFAAYLGDKTGVFPVINGTYTNSFNGVEFNGKLPEITGIYQPLAGMDGIFGTIGANGSVSNVSFSGIKAATCYDYYSAYGVTYDGIVLGSVQGGSISNVTIDNATGMAILNKANNAAYNALTIKNAQGLNFVATDMDLTGDLEIKNWDAASAVAENVFGSLMAAEKDDDYHHVVKLPAAADYSKLSLVVGDDYSLNNINFVVAGLAPFYPVEADQDDDLVVSVLVGDTSIWTGDKFDIQETQYMDGGEVAPAKYSNTSDVVNGYKVNGWYKIEYAEQAASGGVPQTNGVLQRNMDMSYAVNPWKMVTLNHLEGNNKTIKGIWMDETGVAAASVLTSAIAPLDAYKVTNLTVDGVTIDIYTENNEVVPGNIAGLAWRAEDVQNVTVKNLVITGDGANKNNEEYADDEPVFIGWLVANTVNPYIINSKVEGVNNAIGGIAGLVGKITLNTTDASHPGVRIQDSAASNVTAVQTPIAKFTEVYKYNWGKANVAGTSVGYVRNDKGAATSITLSGNDEPVFLFYAPAKINVLYKNGDTEIVNATRKINGTYTTAYDGVTDTTVTPNYTHVVK